MILYGKKINVYMIPHASTIRCGICSAQCAKSKQTTQDVVAFIARWNGHAEQTRSELAFSRRQGTFRGNDFEIHKTQQGLEAWDWLPNREQARLVSIFISIYLSLSHTVIHAYI